jgi:hypothetical protein
MATFYHGTSEWQANCIEEEGFLGSELSTDTSGFSRDRNFNDGVVYLAKDIELAKGYGGTVVQVDIDDSLVNEYQECPVTGLREYFAAVADVVKDAAWWIKED